MNDYYLKKYLWHIGFLIIISLVIQSFFPMILILVELINDAIEQASSNIKSNRSKKIQELSRINEKRMLDSSSHEEERRLRRDKWIEENKVSFTIEGKAIKYTVNGWDEKYERWVFIDIRSIYQNDQELNFDIKKLPGRVDKTNFFDTTKLAKVKAIVRIKTYITRKDGLYIAPQKISFYRSPDSVLDNWSPDGYGKGISKLGIDCRDYRNEVEILGVID